MIVTGHNITAFANLRNADLRNADLRNANLRNANLHNANLHGANLHGADLRNANLHNANLHGADLHNANLHGADLRNADLHGANLHGANLHNADLHNANLHGADLRNADLHGANLKGAINIPLLPWTIIVPDGSLIVYKKVSNGIAKLRIPEDAKRLNGTGRKCRASVAYVLECPLGATSLHDPTFQYHVGKTIMPRESFCEDRWNECASGIHFFLTRDEAENY